MQISINSNIQKQKLTIDGNGAIANIRCISNKVKTQLLDIQQYPNITLNGDPALEQRVTDLEKKGWIVCRNDIHTSSNPFIVSENTEFLLPIRNDSGIYTQAEDSLNNIIDSDTNKINVLNIADGFMMRVEFKLKTVLNNRTGYFDFDIGLAERFNHVKIFGSENAINYEQISFEVPFYQLNTFQLNGGLIKGLINGDAEIYDLSCLIFKIWHGKNI